MTFLPVVERELRISSRKQGTYWNRFGAALAATAVCACLLMIESRMAPDRLGRTLFHLLSAGLYFYIPIAAALATCDSLTVEKRDGTLGLLFLTDLRSYDVIFGKLTSNSLAVVYRVLSVFPVLGVCFLLGGVSNGEMWRTILVSLNLLFLSLAIGMFASAVSRDGWAAARLSIIILVALLFMPFVLSFFMNPPIRRLLSDALSACWIGGGCIMADDSMFRRNQIAFWANAGFIQVLSWTFLRVACHIVPRSWQDRPMSAQPGLWKRISGWLALRPTAQQRGAMLDENPYLWRATHRQTAKLQVWSGIIVLALFWMVLRHESRSDARESLPMILFFAHLIIKLVAAGEASRSISEDRHSGAMELVLTTPLSPSQIVRGQGRAFYKVFIAPMVLVIAIDLMAMLALMQQHISARDETVTVFIVGVGTLLLDVLAIKWTGLWLGLVKRSGLRAISGTVLRILLVPVLGFAAVMALVGISRTDVSFWGVILVWTALSLICDLFFITRAKSELEGRFRAVAARE